MILIVNMNTSLDKHYEMKQFEINTVMRADHVDNTPGGKGIHVANVLQAFDEKCLLTGMLGGKTGEFIEEKLQERRLAYDFQKIQGETRSCLAFTTSDGMQTEVLEAGPSVSAEEYAEFIKRYAKLVRNASLLVCSGSVPQNVPETVYADLIRIAKDYECKVFLDTSGRLLQAGIQMKPYFIKPNRTELETLCKRKMDSVEDIIGEIKAFLAQGIPLVTVSLGEDGSLLGYKDNIYRVHVPKVKVENPVGSGDAFVAGMTLGIQRGLEPQKAVCFAAACGTANAMEKESGFVQRGTVEELLPQIWIEECCLSGKF
jgi:tagatose 6-phosphate kinase